MQAVLKKELLTERRKAVISHDDLWEQLSLAQKFAASSLIQFGYFLVCIRTSNSGNIAILNCGNNTTSISEDGVIHTDNNLKVRH